MRVTPQRPLAASHFNTWVPAESGVESAWTVKSSGLVEALWVVALWIVAFCAATAVSAGAACAAPPIAPRRTVVAASIENARTDMSNI